MLSKNDRVKRYKAWVSQLPPVKFSHHGDHAHSPYVISTKSSSNCSCLVGVRIVVVSVLKFTKGALFPKLFPVSVECLDKLLQSLRTLGTDGAVIDMKHLQGRFVRDPALSKAPLNNVE